MTINSRLFQLFKYGVYALLAFNVYVFWNEEFAAALLQFPGGVPPGDMIEAYAATIDTAAWVVLLLMFELETYVLDDHHYNRLVTWVLQGVRALCYAFIVYAFYGYLVQLGFVYDTAPVAGVVDLCTQSAGSLSYAIDLDEYELITAANCGGFSDATAFQAFNGVPAVVDAAGLIDIQYLAWVDVINAGVWLLVVLVLEIDVRLQERGRFEGLALVASNYSKFVLYGILFAAAVYWGFKGDFVDFWDAFLWLVAFFFIELNVIEWREEEKEINNLQHS